MDKQNKFQNEIVHAALLTIVKLLVSVSIVFVVVVSLTIMARNEFEAQKTMRLMKTLFISNYDNARDFLVNDVNQSIFADVLEHGSGESNIQNKLNRYNNRNELSVKMIVVDSDWNLVYSSFPNTADTQMVLNHNNAVSYNARNKGYDEIYTSVYNRGSAGFSDYMMVKRIINETNETLGYVSLYMSGEDWSYYMSFHNSDGVITDSNNNVLFYNKPKLLQNSYKFEVKSRSTKLSGYRYWGAKDTLDNYKVNIYSFVYNPSNPVMVIAPIMIFIIGILWYRAARQISTQMAEKSAVSIEKIVSEIEIIRQDPVYRIQMDTNDEFEEVGNQINDLLDVVHRLNERNTDLLKLNSVTEMKQLTAQFNPHFLYNTLENLRNLWSIDTTLADDLIHQLTQVLRYSIDDTKSDVTLEEDMRYLDHYIAIQKYRFGDRFECEISIDEACTSCMVPKLLLQPIVENSIKYGYMKTKNLHIEIQGYVQDHNLYLSVKDNGFGMDEDTEKDISNAAKSPDATAHFSGLHNIARRLYLQYSHGSGIELVNQKGVGLEVKLKIKQPM